MTKKSPRIYVYKITFLEVPHYYYGVHKEKVFGEYYVGSPVTNKDFWIFYTPIKEIIKEFEFTDEGWIIANNYEDSLIEPVYNTDHLCLNESCGARISLQVLRRNGLNLALWLKENNKGVYGLSPEERRKNSSKAGKIGGKIGGKVGNREGKRKCGKRAYELKTGVHALTSNEKSENGKKGGEKAYELKLGFHSLPEEEKRKNASSGGKVSSKQLWECTITGHQANPGNLSKYQKRNGIDVKNRKRIN